MGDIIKQNHGGAVNRFLPGESGNPNGRPKKIYTVLKESGYSKDDITDAFAEIGFQTTQDLKDIIKDKTKPVILHLIAKAFLNGVKRGDFRYVSEILSHVIGKPRETVDVTNRNFNITLNLDNDRTPNR